VDSADKNEGIAAASESLMKCGLCQMSLQELLDFKAEALKAMKDEEYLEQVMNARVIANREYTATELMKHQESDHVSFEEQAPTYKDLFGRRRGE
jgi:tRNA U54 and U55 pseudouridine synthase Pus10